MHGTIHLNYDEQENKFYACECGMVSKLAEELKYRVQDSDGNESTITGLEVIENEYWNEADSFEWWSDCTEIEPEEMETEDIKQEILRLLKDLTPKMSYDREKEFIESI